jgi:hypothetical protein
MSQHRVLSDETPRPEPDPSIGSKIMGVGFLVIVGALVSPFSPIPIHHPEHGFLLGALLMIVGAFVGIWRNER